MGTNFYWKVPKKPRKPVTLPTGVVLDAYDVGAKSEDPRIHVGKRSAAGPYCWDCSITLCKEGPQAIHHGHASWYEACPTCDKRQDLPPGKWNRSASIELGFAQADEVRPTGVVCCSSFTWAQDPDKVRDALKAKAEKIVVVDEYDRTYTERAFLAMLHANCPIEFREMIGKAFW
jgi:hypothetical protein